MTRPSDSVPVVSSISPGRRPPARRPSTTPAWRRTRPARRRTACRRPRRGDRRRRTRRSRRSARAGPPGPSRSRPRTRAGSTCSATNGGPRLARRFVASCGEATAWRSVTVSPPSSVAVGPSTTQPAATASSKRRSSASPGTCSTTSASAIAVTATSPVPSAAIVEVHRHVDPARRRARRAPPREQQSASDGTDRMADGPVARVRHRRNGRPGAAPSSSPRCLATSPRCSGDDDGEPPDDAPGVAAAHRRRPHWHQRPPTSVDGRRRPATGRPRAARRRAARRRRRRVARRRGRSTTSTRRSWTRAAGRRRRSVPGLPRLPGRRVAARTTGGYSARSRRPSNRSTTGCSAST